MTNEERKAAMRAIAQVNGMPLADERIDRDAGNYAELLAAVATIRAVDLPLDAEPSPFIVLRPEPRTDTKG